MTHTSRSRELLLGSLLIALVTVLGLGLGELGIRVISSQKLIYNIEMVKYATQLKMPDTLGQVSHVHRPNRSARLMGVDIALNHLGHRGSDLADPRAPIPQTGHGSWQLSHAGMGRAPGEHLHGPHRGGPEPGAPLRTGLQL